MYREAGQRHHKPHFHAEYQGDEAAIAFDGEILEGKLPPSKMKLVIAWAEIHRDDLEANWKLLTEGRECSKISPLN
jgi:hypothetical protein